MWIKKVTVNNCRLLKNISLEFSQSLNLIIGPNASGKTSLLESLSILSSGRSFRTSHVSELITNQEESIRVVAEIHIDKANISIGIEKNQQKTKIRIDKQDVYSQAQLSSNLPITVIHPNSIDLITGSPSLRRSYIDWIAFYLFPEFHSRWKEYQHILKQRNLCLKNPKHHYALDKWTEELVRSQPELTIYRSQVIDLINPILNKIAKILLPKITVFLEFNSGFPKEVNIDKTSLLEFYESKKEYDYRIKRTSAGIHRADMKIMMDGNPAEETASRGQLKLLAICLLLTQSDSIDFKNNTKGILLIDDLAAELDNLNKKKLLTYLSELNKQLIITATKNIEFDGIEAKVFHVKHGEIKND